MIKLTVFLKVTYRPEENCSVLKTEQMMMLTWQHASNLVVYMLFFHNCLPIFPTTRPD